MQTNYYLDRIPACTAYQSNGIATANFPVTPVLNRAKPVYTWLEGWKCDIRGINKYEDLPINTKRYIEFIEKEIGFPIKFISNGPKREDIILRSNL